MSQKSKPKYVFHYTSHHSFCSILKSRELWAHDYRLTNDSREISYALGLARLAVETDDECNKAFKGFINIFEEPFDPFNYRDIYGYLFLSSFSEEPNILSQWRAYAPQNGYSLGFHLTSLQEQALEAGFTIAPVRYDFQEALGYLRAELKPLAAEITNSQLSDLDAIDRFGTILRRIAPLVKHESFCEEKEWRAYQYMEFTPKVQYYPGRRCLTPYLPLTLTTEKFPTIIPSLRQVIVGPSDDQHLLMEWTKDYLTSLGYIGNWERARTGERYALQIEMTSPSLSGRELRNKQCSHRCLVDGDL